MQEHRELAREAVRKSLVLLKNGKVKEGPVLPLPKKTESILVAGSHAHNLGYQCGGWTVTWQGISGNDNITGNVQHSIWLQFSFDKILNCSLQELQFLRP